MFNINKINIFRSFKRIGLSIAKAFECWNNYFLAFIIVDRSGNYRKIDYDVIFGELKKCGKFETVHVLVSSAQRISEENHLVSKVHLGFKTEKRIAYRNEQGMLYALEAFSRLCRTLYQSQLPTKPYGKEFVKTLV